MKFSLKKTDIYIGGYILFANGSRISTNEIIQRHQIHAPELLHSVSLPSLIERPINAARGLSEHFAGTHAGFSTTLTGPSSVWLKAELFEPLAQAARENVLLENPKGRFFDGDMPSDYVLRIGDNTSVSATCHYRRTIEHLHNHPMATEADSFLLTPSGADLSYENFSADLPLSDSVMERLMRFPQSTEHQTYWPGFRSIISRMGFCYYSKPGIPDNLKCLGLPALTGNSNLDTELRKAAVMHFGLYTSIMKTLIGMDIRYVPLDEQGAAILTGNDHEGFFNHLTTAGFFTDNPKYPKFNPLYEKVRSILLAARN